MATRERGPAAAVETEEPREAQAPVYQLQLQPRAHVTFDESVVDNEHLGRKKSNSALLRRRLLCPRVRLQP